MAAFSLRRPNGDEFATPEGAGEVQPGNTLVGEYGAPLEFAVRNDSGEAQGPRDLFVYMTAGGIADGWVYLSLDGVSFTQGSVALGGFAVGESKTVYLDVRAPESPRGSSDIDLYVGTLEPLGADVLYRLRVEQSVLAAEVGVPLWGASVDVVTAELPDEPDLHEAVVSVPAYPAVVKVDFIIGDRYEAAVSVDEPDLKARAWVDVPAGDERLGIALVNLPYGP